MLALKSKVIRDLLTACSQAPQSSTDQVEVPLLGESDEDVELLWELWHGKRQLLHEIRNVMHYNQRLQVLERICNVTKLADKYQSEGKCMRGWVHV